MYNSNGLIHIPGIKKKHQCLIYLIKTDSKFRKSMWHPYTCSSLYMSEHIQNIKFFYLLSKRLKLSKPPYTNNSPQSTYTYTHNTNTL